MLLCHLSLNNVNQVQSQTTSWKAFSGINEQKNMFEICTCRRSASTCFYQTVLDPLKVRTISRNTSQAFYFTISFAAFKNGVYEI